MNQTQVLAAPAGPLLDRIARPYAPFAEPLVRATIGLFLVPHGAQKLFGWFGGYGLEATGQFFASKLGLPASLALAAGVIEVFGGLALAFGLGTRLAALLVAGTGSSGMLTHTSPSRNSMTSTPSRTLSDWRSNHCLNEVPTAPRRRLGRACVPQPPSPSTSN